MTEPCTRCGKKIDPETPIQIGDPLICDICTDDINTPMTEEHPLRPPFHWVVRSNSMAASLQKTKE